MVLSGLEIREQLGKNIVIEPFDEARLNPNSYNLALHDELMVYEELVLDMRKPNRVRRLAHSRGGAGPQPGTTLPGPHRRADRDPQPRADDRGPLVGRAAGAVRPRHRRVRRRGLLRLLDARDVRRAAGPHLPGRPDLPDLLPRDPRRLPSNTPATSTSTTPTSSRASCSRSSIPSAIARTRTSSPSAWSRRSEAPRGRSAA
jgi:hypothetical protein